MVVSAVFQLTAAMLIQYLQIGVTHEPAVFLLLFLQYIGLSQKIPEAQANSSFTQEKFSFLDLSCQGGEFKSVSEHLQGQSFTKWPLGYFNWLTARDSFLNSVLTKGILIDSLV